MSLCRMEDLQNEEEKIRVSKHQSWNVMSHRALPVSAVFFVYDSWVRWKIVVRHQNRTLRCSYVLWCSEKHVQDSTWAWNFFTSIMCKHSTSPISQWTKSKLAVYWVISTMLTSVSASFSRLPKDQAYSIHVCFLPKRRTYTFHDLLRGFKHSIFTTVPAVSLWKLLRLLHDTKQF
jgi:hypothetical protein